MKTINEKFDEKLKTYDKDGGFIVYVDEEYPNEDFDTDLIKSFFTSEIQNLFTAMLAECDKTENEDGRFLVEKFRKEFD